MKAEKLRKSILQYAIQGKLVPQIDTEEPANILLEKITKEKKRLIKTGNIKSSKALLPPNEEDIPFELPDTWCWTRLENVAALFTGDSINAEEKKKKYLNLEEGYNYIATKDVDFNNTINYDNGVKIPFKNNFRIAKASSTLLCIEGGSAGKKVGLLNQDVCFGNKLCSTQPILINSQYLFYFLQSPTFTMNFTDNKSGMIGGVGVNTIKTFYFPLPPIQEQQRIATRIEELMLLADEYEEKQTELEKLETEFPEKLKKSILQYAIQGKLVPQLETEEPANELIEKIKKEKAELIKQGKMKKEKPLPPITDEEKPFEVPDSWEWSRLQDVFIVNPRNQVNDDFDVSFIPMTSLGQGFNNTFTGEEKKWHQVKSNFTHLKNQDVAFAKIVPSFQNRKSAIMQNLSNGYGAGTTELHVLRKYTDKIDCNYTLWFVKSSFFIDNCEANMTGTAGQQRVPTDYVKKFPFPLPPIDEQRRIVTRIEQLFKLADLLSSDKKIKLLDKAKDITNLKVISNNNTVQPDFDMESVGLAARADEDIDNDTANEVKRQVQAYYDKKN